MSGRIWVTRDEARTIFAERLRAIRDAPGIRMSNDRRYAVGPEPIRGDLYLAGRDRNRCILATVYVTHGASGTARYMRKLRIPRQGSYADRTVAFRRRG